MRIKLERAGYFLTINSIIFGFQKPDKIQRGEDAKAVNKIQATRLQ